MYVFDSSSLMQLFRYYPSRFPSLWKAFDILVTQGEITSVKEVFNEINKNQSLINWAKTNKHLFTDAGPDEALFIQQIFSVKQFQQVQQQLMLKGGAHADPFVIAKAKIFNGIVVTEETSKPNSSRIPTVCQYFKIDCIDLEGFMTNEIGCFSSFSIWLTSARLVKTGVIHPQLFYLFRDS